MTRVKNDQEVENAKQVLKMVGARIRSIREAKGEPNYEKFAFKRNLSRTQLWRYENGEDFRFTSLLKVLTALDISLTDFFGEGFDKMV
ncbi:helix-turn-helix domain-containing protein [Pedobacter sp. Leaf176]|uniref:helix-turn-helix domain-containing protein n=1 Tax=Pedobacter sp. Leaf176 TaxID=1736286 RepID=UPI0006FDF548|nr:helix-turn-helix transcriptional regulator [Pedobacter sp. Leaf176]KQR71208.1 hypothetical protein ASF92_07425 [Pedobacter sp. Leaf176]